MWKNPSLLFPLRCPPMLVACLASALDTRILSIRHWRISFGIDISRRFRVLFVPKLLRKSRFNGGRGERAPGGRICRTGKKRVKYVGHVSFRLNVFRVTFISLTNCVKRASAVHGHSANTDFRLILSSSFLSTPSGGGGGGHKQNKRGSFSLFLSTTLSLRGRLRTIMKRGARGSVTLNFPPTHISGDRNGSFPLSVKLCFGKIRGEIESILTAMQAGLSSLRLLVLLPLLLLIGYAMLAAPVFRVGFFWGASFSRLSERFSKQYCTVRVQCGTIRVGGQATEKDSTMIRPPRIEWDSSPTARQSNPCFAKNHPFVYSDPPGGEKGKQ